MASDFEIGRVVAVDTAQVTIELNQDLKALTRTTYEGPQEIGRINSYVILPVGARRLVAMVTRVVLTEEAEIRADRTMVTLPAARRVMKATLIGTIDSRSFTQGVSLFPVLDNPVHLATAADLNLIFDGHANEASAPPDPKKPGFCVPLGDSAVFEGYPIQIDPDAFFGKHAAVLGSTGSGKSCTIASLIQSILERGEVRRTHFVILDTNGEYRSAFQRQDGDGTWKDIGERRFLYIPSDPGESASRLVIPYWFLNAEDFVRLFRASQGVQRPILLETLRLSRNESSNRTPAQILREELVHEFNRVWSLSGKDEKTSKDVRDLGKGLLARIGEAEFAEAWEDLEGLGVRKQHVEQAIETVVGEAEKHIEDPYPKVIPADSRAAIQRAIDPIFQKLTGAKLGAAGEPSGLSADTPAFFDKLRFRTRHIEQVLRREESGGARARDFCGTMLLRMDRLLADGRFEFLFGPTNGKFPDPEHAMATFLRDILGLESCPSPSPPLSNEASVPGQTLPFYDRQRSGASGYHVVILDLSLLAAEVLENVTALIGRLILEFLQRLGECGEIGARGSLPVVLVLEEAQNYIREPRYGEEESISRVVFERIAREGRKQGLGLVVSSQRPSELSKTVLSQCSSFVVHRLQNPEDLRYFREIVPGIYGDLLNQLPALAPQTALVLGECVRAPALVRIRETRPLPRSRDPRFYEHWVAETPTAVSVEGICALWEGKDTGTSQETGAPPGTDRSTASAPGPEGSQRGESGRHG
jgi:DNA helicase HerA-like ATPase